MTILQSRWSFGDRVHIDGDSSITAVVTAICFRPDRAAVMEISWFHDGDSKSAWIEDLRLTNAGEGSRRP